MFIDEAGLKRWYNADAAKAAIVQTLWNFGLAKNKQKNPIRTGANNGLVTADCHGLIN